MNHNHHLEWLEDNFLLYEDLRFLFDKFDFEEMMIDWECSRFTKEASPLNAREQLQEFGKLKYITKYPNCIRWWYIIKEKCEEVLDKYDF